jgi:hypothetical protein
MFFASVHVVIPTEARTNFPHRRGISPSFFALAFPCHPACSDAGWEPKGGTYFQRRCFGFSAVAVAMAFAVTSPLALTFDFHLRYTLRPSRPPAVGRHPEERIDEGSLLLSPLAFPCHTACPDAGRTEARPPSTPYGYGLVWRNVPLSVMELRN